MNEPAHFSRFAAIDWSGAKGNRHRGIALATCVAGADAPALVTPPAPSWSRVQILNWLLAHRDQDMLVGFDFSFSAPFVERGAHLPGERATPDGPALWAHVDRECDDDDLGATSFIEARRGRHFYLGAADGTKRDFLFHRRCEVTEAGVKPSTVYDAIGAAQVCKASFSGMRLLNHVDGRIPIWPFDPLPARGMAIVEIYTSIAARATGMRRGLSKIRDAVTLDLALDRVGSSPHARLSRYDDHATDAILTAAWLRVNAVRSELWSPAGLTPQIARTEGWTFGVA